MIRLFYFIAAISFSIFLSCEKHPQEQTPSDNNLKGYKELLEAYDAGKMFKMVQADAYADIVVFEDGSKITVPSTSFEIYDHTDTKVPVIEVVPGMSRWSIDGSLTSFEALPASVAKEDAEPVYVYFDRKTLYMYISNRQVLVFNSKALEEYEEDKIEQEEIARHQNIPVIYIDTGGKGIYDKKNYVDGIITIKDPELLYSDVAEFSARMGIRGRGNSTWSFPKKPWKVKLEEKASILGLPADKEWCLLANYADRTLLRNVVAMELSRICGFKWTPRMISVEVYLNDKYQGVYTFCEHKKISSDRVDIDIDAGDVYLEIEQQQDETTCWWTGMGVPMMFSDPEEPSPEQLKQIKQYFEDFEKTLYSDDIADPELGYAAYIDVDSFIDYFIVQELTKNTDGNLRKSTFITKEKDKKLQMYHLWDFDLTLGNNGGFLHSPEGYWVKDYAPSCVPGDNWYNRMFTDPAFARRVRDRWNELLPQFEQIPSFIDRQALYLDKAKDRNFQVWSIWESVDWVQCPSLGSYEKEINFLKEFYTERLDWMTKELNNQ